MENLNLFAFDIETIPDYESGEKLYDCQGLSREDIIKVMLNQRRQKSGTEFMRHHLHKVVAISVVLRNKDQLHVMSLGEVGDSEEHIVQRFFDAVNRLTPTLITWNGVGFDCPVLHYRALKYGIVSQNYWDTGRYNSDFRFNNYTSRFHQRHTDLMDVLSGYQFKSNAPLDEISVMLGFPGKMGMKGNKVLDYYQQGKIAEIRDYCETDALNTYLVYLKYLLISGKIGKQQWQDENTKVYTTLQKEAPEKLHFQEFLNAWHFQVDNNETTNISN